MRDLLLSLTGLLLGPVAYRVSERRDELYGFLDGFVLVGVAGLILADVLPASLEAVGAVALPYAVAGFALPFALERRLALLPFSPHAFFRWLMILGLALHQLLDGVALSRSFPSGHGESLRLAVILHQVPKGFFIWSMVGGALGRRMGAAVMAGLCLATVGGFALGDQLAGLVSGTAAAARPVWLFQAFIGGGLLHVIVHHVPRSAAASAGGCGCPGAPAGVSRRSAFFGGLGAAASLAALLAFYRPENGIAAGGGFRATFADFVVDSAPSILLGFAAAGIFQAFLPKVLFSWLGGRGRMSQALRGIAIGLPLPLCSCGVVPVYLSLLRKSVPPAAALAFLIATPEIGVDSIFLSARWLGIQITVIRLVMAFLIALGVGFTLARTFERIQGKGDLERSALPEERPLPVGFRAKLVEALRFGGLEIVDHTGAWLVVGIGVAAVLEPYTTPDWLAGLGHGLDVLLFSLIGLPLYVCASGAAPLAAVLLHKGVSAGAVLAFLITGPSTNVTTFGILKRYHGVRGAVLYAVAVYGFSIAAGFAVNAAFPHPETPVLTGEHPPPTPFALGCTAVLVALFVSSILRLGPRGLLATLGESLGGPPAADAPRHHGHRHDHALVAAPGGRGGLH